MWEYLIEGGIRRVDARSRAHSADVIQLLAMAACDARGGPEFESRRPDQREVRGDAASRWSAGRAFGDEVGDVLRDATL
jgi:hypothetical protein